MSETSIWTKLYGFRSKSFIEGVIAGVSMYAVWKDGKEVVGILEEPLEQIITEIKAGLGWPEVADE